MKSIKQIKKKKIVRANAQGIGPIPREVYEKYIILMLKSVDKKKHERNKEQKLRV